MTTDPARPYAFFQQLWQHPAHLMLPTGNPPSSAVHQAMMACPVPATALNALGPARPPTLLVLRADADLHNVQLDPALLAETFEGLLEGRPLLLDGPASARLAQLVEVGAAEWRAARLPVLVVDAARQTSHELAAHLA